MKTSRENILPYITKDGSEIRELMHPEVHGNHLQSLAEATILAGQRTLLHRHLRTEEIYHVTEGRGLLSLDDETFAVCAGDTVCIPPGTAHRIENPGPGPLQILCCCAPAYSHGDTEVMEQCPER